MGICGHCRYIVLRSIPRPPHLKHDRIAEELLLDRDLGGLPWDLKMFGNHLLVSVHHGEASRPSLKVFRLEASPGMSAPGKACFVKELLCESLFATEYVLVGHLVILCEPAQPLLHEPAVPAEEIVIFWLVMPISINVASR